MRTVADMHWRRLFVLGCLVLGEFGYAVPDARELVARSTITVNVDTTLTTTVSGTQPTTLVTSTSISLTGTSAIVSYIQTAIPSDVRSESSYGCFVNSQYSYYPTPAWYTSLPPEVQSYYSSINQGNTAACTGPGTSSTGTSGQPQQSSSGSGLSTGAKVGIAMGVIGAVAAIASALWSIFKGNPCGHHSSPNGSSDGPSQAPSKPPVSNPVPGNPGATSPPPGYQSPTPMSQPHTPGWDGTAGNHGPWDGVPGSQAPPPWNGTAGGNPPPAWNGTAGVNAPWNGAAGGNAPPGWNGTAGTDTPWNGTAGGNAPPGWNGTAGTDGPWNGAAGGNALPAWNGTAGTDTPWNGTAGGDVPPNSGNQPGSGWNGVAGGGGDWSGAAGGGQGNVSQGGTGQIPFIPIVAGAYRRDKDRKEPQQRTSSYTASNSNLSGHTSPALVSTPPPRSSVNELAASGISSHSPWEGYSNESVRAEMPVGSSPFYHETHTDYAPVMAHVHQRSASSQSIPRRPVGSRNSSGAQTYHGSGSSQPYVGSNARQGSYNIPNRAVEAYSSPTQQRMQAAHQESGSSSIYESGSRTIHEADQVNTRRYQYC